MRIALHTCCGPCLLEPYDALVAEHEIVIVYANPNIQPAEEYRLRRDTLFEYARWCGMEVVEVAYDADLWDGATAAVRATRKERCSACYELRLRLSAEVAVRQGCQALSTTLSVSPYQDPDVLDDVGARVAAAHGLTWLGRDWRSRYPEATRRSRELGMYRQNYCGCLPSRDEATRSRAARREARRERRDT